MLLSANKKKKKTIEFENKKIHNFHKADKNPRSDTFSFVILRLAK